MKKKPTYKEQFDKITRAYIANELKPYSNCACFIGNLLGGEEWSMCRLEYGKVGNSNILLIAFYMQAIDFIHDMSAGLYSPKNILDMEKNFLEIISFNTSKSKILGDPYNKVSHSNYENALFLAMESTLKMLKQIHIDSGEIVDQILFEQRQLQTV